MAVDINYLQGSGYCSYWYHFASYRSASLDRCILSLKSSILYQEKRPSKLSLTQDKAIQSSRDCYLYLTFSTWDVVNIEWWHIEPYIQAQDTTLWTHINNKVYLIFNTTQNCEHSTDNGKSYFIFTTRHNIVNILYIIVHCTSLSEQGRASCI